MTTNLNTFKAVWTKSGFAPTNRFQFLLSPPPKMFDIHLPKLNLSIPYFPIKLSTTMLEAPINKAASNITKELLAFSCKKVTIPSSAFNESYANLNGNIKYRAGKKDYDPITMHFYVDANHLVRQFFVNWHNIIMNSNNKERSYPKDYLSQDSLIVIYDNTNKSISPAADVIFKNLWPMEIGEIELDWESDELMILPVTFRYDYWYNSVEKDFSKFLLNKGIRSIINTASTEATAFIKSVF